jgi:hypothetical protein
MDHAGFSLSALSLGPVTRLERRFERLLGADVLEVVAVGEAIAVGEQVAPPELRRVGPELLGDHVHVGLPGEDHLGLAGGTSMPAGNAVGVDTERFDREMRNAIDARAHGGAAQVTVVPALRGVVPADPPRAVPCRLTVAVCAPSILLTAGRARSARPEAAHVRCGVGAPGVPEAASVRVWPIINMSR